MALLWHNIYIQQRNMLDTPPTAVGGVFFAVNLYFKEINYVNTNEK